MEEPNDLEASPDRPPRRRPSKLALGIALTPLIALTIGANVGSAFFPTLIDKHPLALIALDPRARNLVLIVTQVGVVAFFAVAIFRRLIADPCYFMIGRWYGDAGVRWLERKSPDLGSVVQDVEAWFPRWGRLIIFIYPHPLAIVLAGASAMSMLEFMTWNILGTIFVVSIVWWLGQIFKEELLAVTDFIKDYSLPLTVVSFGLVMLYVWNSQRKGTSQLESVGQMEHELDAEWAKKDVSHQDRTPDENA